MTVFFDIDDTLYDRSMPFTEAAKEFFKGAVDDLPGAYLKCTERGNEVFLPSQRGEISMDEMHIYRWSKGFADMGISITPDEALAFQGLYRKKQDCISLNPVMYGLLSYCSEKADGIGVITNGPSDKQRSKAEHLGLERFMKRDMIIISGDVGTDKPDKEIFHLAEKRSGAQPGELIYVGDSLKNDILPALDCGWHAVWFNRGGRPIPKNLKADAIVSTEEDLSSAINRMI